MMPLLSPRVIALVALLACSSLVGLGCSDGGTIAPATSSTLLPSTSASPGATPGVDASASAVPATLTPSPADTASAGPGGQPISDRALRTSLTMKFAADPSLLHVKVRVRVRDGVVYLYARVADQAQKTAIETIAVSEPGVKKVVSTIIVDTQNNGGTDAAY